MPHLIPIKKPQQEKIEELKKQYPIRKRVKLIRMKYEEPLKSGTLGTIFGVDDLGQIVVEWDCGSEISLIPEVDEFEVVEN